jgi:hypothetical protein
MTSIIDLIPIDEELVRQAANIMEPTEPNNSFQKVLAQAADFRQAGLTPVIFHTKDLSQIYVTTREMIDKEYN